MDNIIVYSGLLAVGFIWGITNPFMEKGSKTNKVDEFDISFKFFY